MKKQSRRGRQFNLVCTPAELKLWRKYAAESEMSLAVWIRRMLSQPRAFEIVSKGPQP